MKEKNETKKTKEKTRNKKEERKERKKRIKKVWSFCPEKTFRSYVTERKKERKEKKGNEIYLKWFWILMHEKKKNDINVKLMVSLFHFYLFIY